MPIPEDPPAPAESGRESITRADALPHFGGADRPEPVGRPGPGPRTLAVTAVVLLGGIAATLAVAFLPGSNQDDSNQDGANPGASNQEGSQQIGSQQIDAQQGGSRQTVSAQPDAQMFPIATVPPTAEGSTPTTAVTRGSGSAGNPAASAENRSAESASSADANGGSSARTSTSTAAATWTSTELTAGDGLSARAYFGRFSQVVHGLQGTVSFTVDDGYLAAHADRCVLTVVFSGVSGTEAVVYADALGEGWRASEGTPDPAVATDSGVVHHQLMAPPPDRKVGSSGSYYANLVVDGTDSVVSASYTLELTARSGSERIWSLAGSPVSCSVD